MKNFFKRIWNFFFKKKEKEYKFEDYFNPKDFEAMEESRRAHNKPRTQLFRKQQLLGKVYNIGKSRFRINKKLGLTASEKLRYEITQL